MFDETTGGTAVEDTPEVSAFNEDTTEVGGGEALGDVLDTPSLALPPSQAEVHRGTIVSVEAKTSENTGNTFGIISLQSIDTSQSGNGFELMFFPPQSWFEEWPDGKFDPNTLSDEPPPGKKQSPRVGYARNVSSTQAAFDNEGKPITKVTGKEGTLQLLRKLAALEGLTLEAGTPAPTSGEEYVGLINSLVAGRLEVVFTRKPEKNDDPAFDGRLKVNAIHPKSIIEEPSFEKRFKSYRLAWNG